MTVINTTNSVREVGNAVKVAFDFDFKIFETSDLQIFKIDTSVDPEVSTLQVETTDYTVSILTPTEGGTVTYVVAPLATEDSFISRLFELTQPTDIPREANFPEESIEGEFDRSRMIDIQQQADLDLKIGFAPTSTTTDVIFPEPEAGKAIIWNAAGDDLENSTTSFEDVITAAAASAAAAATSASNAATSESNAATSASNAATSASNAATSESNAAASAAAAAASVLVIPDPTGGSVADQIRVNAAQDAYELFTPAGAGVEVNNLEADGAADIADTEIPIGTGAGTVNYAALSGDVTMDNAGVVAVIDFALSGEVAEDFAVYDGTNWKPLGLAELVKHGVFTRDNTVADGSQAITGVGFKPKAIIFIAAISSTPTASVGMQGAGVGATEQGSLIFNKDGVNGDFGVGSTNVITSFTGIAISNTGKVSTVDSDGFTIGWVKSGAPTGITTVRFMAFR